MKISLVVPNFGPYHLARLSAFQKQSIRSKWICSGIQLAQKELEYPWEVDFSNSSIPLISIVESEALEDASFINVCVKLIQILHEKNPYILVLTGYARPTMIAAILWGVINRKKLILLSESKEDDFPRNPMKEFTKSCIVKCFDASLVGGKPHKRYLQKLGVPEQSIFYGYDVIDNDTFSPVHNEYLPRPVEKNYFLSINRFISKKNLPFLINAYAQYRQKISSDIAYDLVLCGDGLLRSELEAIVSSLCLKKHIHFPGFLQQKELLPYFAHASCFIHASIQEQWGLVVNEAMAAALPILVSNRCGCYEDLIIEGVNGFGFDPENLQQLVELMLKISSGDIDIRNMGDAGLEHIQKFSPNYFSQGLTQAVEYALGNR